MSRISRHHIRRAQRSAPDDTAAALRKIVLIQEQQIAELVAERGVLQAIVIGASALAFDYVDPRTGEVTRRPLLGGGA